jgi:hypothetical protein
MPEFSASDISQATKVLETFMAAGTRHDEPAMRACLNRRTIESGNMDAAGGPEGMRFVLDNQHTEGEQLVIRARAFPVDSKDDTSPALELACLMVKEDGQWKFDLAGSVDRMMGSGGLEKVVEQMTTAIGDAMKGVGEALSAGLQQAFGQTEPAAQPTLDSKSSTWNGTWIGNWEGGHGTQIVFAGDTLICVYWHDDYLPDVQSEASADGATVTITWPSGRAVLTRDGETTGHIVISEQGKPEASFDVKRDNG